MSAASNFTAERKKKLRGFSRIKRSEWARRKNRQTSAKLLLNSFRRGVFVFAVRFLYFSFYFRARFGFLAEAKAERWYMLITFSFQVILEFHENDHKNSHIKFSLKLH